MPRNLRITRVEVHEYAYEVKDLGVDYNGFNGAYAPGATARMTGYVVTIATNEGVTGEYAGGMATGYGQVPKIAKYLIGRDPLQRELIYNDLKRAFRKEDRLGMGPIDTALWDLAGKLYGAPLYELLGGWRTRLPAYASTYHGDENGGLTTPEQFAEFAIPCREMGYKAFKIHGWGTGPIQREIDNVLATRKAVGPEMDLMLDPACEYNTWAETLKVGRACDEAGFFWLEDPYKDGGISAFGHRKLRQIIKTPILIGEHIRGHELHVDNIVADGTDYVRADADYDGGVTGLMKIAHSAEGFGLDVEIHAPGPEHRHCMAAIRNTNYYELGLVHPKLKVTKPPLYACGYSDELDAIDKDGTVPVPTGPGLGVTIDWDWVGKNRVGHAVYA